MAASVRYIVEDVDAAIEFYRDALGFALEMHPAPGFAALARGGLRLLLNQPGAGGAGQAMPDGRRPAPGGWNRVVIEVADIEAEAARLRAVGCRFRGAIVAGKGGKQILLDDPSAIRSSCSSHPRAEPGRSRQTNCSRINRSSSPWPGSNRMR